MNSRNETLFQNTMVELSDEVLADVVGGCGEPDGYEQPWNQDWNGGQSCERGHRGERNHCRGLLGDLLCDLL